MTFNDLAGSIWSEAEPVERRRIRLHILGDRPPGTTREESITTAATGQDVISALRDQHEQVKAMIADIESATPADRSRLFGDLRRLLAAHGAAEEEVIHPQARDNLNSHAAVVDDRLAEEAQAAKAIGKLEELDPSSADFVTEFDKFTQAVISHAEHEEHDEFPALRDTSDPAVIEQMMTTLQHVGQIAIGQDAMPDRENSFAAMLDRARAEVRSQKNRG